MGAPTGGLPATPAPAAAVTQGNGPLPGPYPSTSR
jgi:hypothetical protein